MNPWQLVVQLLGWSAALLVFLFIVVVLFSIVTTFGGATVVWKNEWINMSNACDIIIRLILLANLQDSEHAAVGRAYRFIRIQRAAGVQVDVPDQLAKYLFITSDGSPM